MAKENSKKAITSKNVTRIFLVDRFICNFIAMNWFVGIKSNREIARIFGIHHNLVKKIKDKDGYKIPSSTLATICFYKGVKMSDFFKLLESEYGNKINDDFVERK